MKEDKHREKISTHKKLTKKLLLKHLYTLSSRRLLPISLLLMLLFLQACTASRILRYRDAEITDYDIFPYREIDKSSQPFQFEEAESKLKPDSISFKRDGKDFKQEFDEYLEENETVAFLVIQNDSIKYKRYFNGYSESSIINSFSITKSLVSMLIGIAIDDGLIESANQSITHYLPELKENGFDKITINNLLDMRSGIKFSEVYGAFGDVAKFYYTKDLRKEVSKLKLEEQPSNKTLYKSCDTQILGLILDRVLQGETISNYLEEKIWLPLGMEYQATWSLDKEDSGIEKTFCCFNARAVDFAKLGRLYLNRGEWNGKRVVSEEWVVNSTKFDTTKGDDANYNNQWWVYDDSSFTAKGILGQYIFVSPKTNSIIIRFGSDYGKYSNWIGLFRLIEKQLATEN